jgi:hypothetical protein
MKYKILEILSGQIRVEFEDNSWAIVPIKPNASLEEIDHAVSEFDPYLLPKPESIINPDISVGDERESKKIAPQPQSLSVEIVSAEPPIPISSNININFGDASPFDVIILSQYYAENGDNRLKDALDVKIQKLISNSDFLLDKLILDLNYDMEDIVRQAESELNGQ